MQTNAQNAALVMQLMNVPKDKIKEILQRWPGIDHRLQYFHSWKNKNGVTYKFYNDTCATVPEAAAAATQAFETPVTLITGGTDKGLELNKFTETVINNDGKFLPVKEMYFLAGTATDKILPELDKAKVKYNGPFNSLCELLDAVKKDISEKDGKDEIVVFSPGATSFGMFSNEFDRGNQFMNGIKERF